jgi:hypothetical protein
MEQFAINCKQSGDKELPKTVQSVNVAAISTDHPQRGSGAAIEGGHPWHGGITRGARQSLQELVQAEDSKPHLIRAGGADAGRRERI